MDHTKDKYRINTNSTKNPKLMLKSCALIITRYTPTDTMLKQYATRLSELTAVSYNFIQWVPFAPIPLSNRLSHEVYLNMGGGRKPETLVLFTQDNKRTELSPQYSLNPCKIGHQDIKKLEV
jgi:hypothetical protein